MNLLITAIIVEKKMISHDTILVRLKLLENVDAPRLIHHVYIYDDERNRKNPYSPILWNKKEICVIMKMYKRHGIPDFMNSKNINDKIYLSQPILSIKYQALHENILMICGGTGITPMLQMIINDPNRSKFTIVSCNKTLNDIILNRDIVDADLKVIHVISNYTDEEIENQIFFYINEDKSNVIKGKIEKSVISDLQRTKGIKLFNFVYVCGPPGFMEVVCGKKNEDLSQGKITGFLETLGYENKNTFKL
jgi:cytochrome-b5 reductase